MCIIVDGTAVKILALKFLVIMEVITERCRCNFWDTWYMILDCTKFPQIYFVVRLLMANILFLLSDA